MQNVFVISYFRYFDLKYKILTVVFLGLMSTKHVQFVVKKLKVMKNSGY